MNKVILVLIFILLLAGIIYYYKNNIPQTSDINKENQIQEGGDSSLVSQISKTNPFTVDINPVRGYKNPFSK
ncbi:hypothetical protein M0R01_04690 [bacterium]|nr:hypothetical protein [bacterium]